jgi:hypothetical protein
MSLFWNIAIPLGFIDMLVSFSVAFATYKYLAWKASQALKKKYPTEKNGLNLDFSYRIEGSEVFGIHVRGVDMLDLIDNVVSSLKLVNEKTRGFKEADKHGKDNAST